jgi:PHS family inorganic phosphate transporter-like MFS transporter
MDGYGSFAIDEEYSVAIHPLPEELVEAKRHASSPATSTLASSDSEILLDRYIENYSHQEPREREGTGYLAGMWHFLGFTNNPLYSSNDSSRARNSAAADMRLAMLSNFSTAYNIVSISLALRIMEDVYPSITAEDKSLCSSALIAGMIVGQLGGGTLGDIFGRHVAMTFVMFLQVVAAFFSAFSADYTLFGAEFSIYTALAVWRFILGIGAGGVYPLAATITSESSPVGEERGKSVALTFSMQGVGYLVVPLTAWLMVELLGQQSDFAWRLLLGLGALPGVLLTILRTSRSLKRTTDCSPNQRNNESDMTFQHVNIEDTAFQHVNIEDTAFQHVNIEDTAFQQVNIEEVRTAPVSVLDAILIEPNLLAKLIGTGGCWFFFDILFYGNTLFQPMVLSSAFGAAETVEKVAADTTIIAFMALPGYIVSIAAVGRQGPRFIQLQGFLIMGILYAVIGFYFDSLAKSRWLMLMLYSLTFFWSNYGPNSTVGLRGVVSSLSAGR